MHIYLFIYFYHHLNKLVNVKPPESQFLKKKTQKKPISVKMYEWKNVDFFFLRSGFVYPQSPKLTLFSFKTNG